MQRAVWDNRDINARFRRPPTVAMASPSAIAELDLSEGVTHGKVLRTWQGDVPDYFYRVLLPASLWPFFVFPIITTAELISYAAAQGVTIPAPRAEEVFVCLAVMSMGWSWAPFFAQLMLEEAVEKADEDLHPHAKVQDRAPTPSLAEFAIIWWAFIDDYLGATLEDSAGNGDGEAEKRAEKMKAGLGSQGIPVHKDETGTSARATIGVHITSPPHRLGPVHMKLLELILATTHLCRVAVATAEQVRVWVGIWTWMFMTFRPAFSIFSATYAWVQRNLKAGKTRLWDAVVAELATAVSVAPLLVTELTAAWSRLVFQTDASLEGFGIAWRRSLETEIRQEVAGERHYALSAALDRQMALEEDIERAGWGAAEAVSAAHGEAKRRVLQEPKRGKGVLHLCARSGSLSDGIRKSGLSWVDEWDRARDPKKDVLKPERTSSLMRRIQNGAFWLLLAQFPRSTWRPGASNTMRSRLNIMGSTGDRGDGAKRVNDANKLATTLIDMAWAVLEAGGGFAFFLCPRSLLLSFPPMKQLLRNPGVFRVTTDGCCFGAATRMRTVIVTNVPLRQKMRRCCSCAIHPPDENSDASFPTAFSAVLANILAVVLKEGVLRARPELAGRTKAPKPQFQEAGLCWRDPTEWALSFKGTWDREEPITQQEVRTVGLLARHLARAKSNWGLRLLVLVDSMASIGALSKGRSSIYGILLQCRCFCAISMVTGIRFTLRWCSTLFNYADGPSRGFPVGLAPETAAKAVIETAEEIEDGDDIEAAMTST